MQRVSAKRLTAIQNLLLAWFDEHARDLPWRRTRDPYAILVSEVMLQQIQVARAIPFYLAFLERFPTVDVLAAAPLSEVIRVWGDLGRYRRITNLHATAKRIVTEFDGDVPSDVETLRTFPGIGPYTAGAVACFAFEQDVAFLDTNARRVIHRLFIGNDVPTPTVPDKDLRAITTRAVPKGQGWLWNQALIEFGALRCTARRPACAGCTLQPSCRAYPAIEAALSGRPPVTGRGSTSAYEGTNRYYRGRVLARLRAEAGTVDLCSLGSELRADFTPAELPWIAGVVESLRKDGLATIEETRPTYDAGETASELPATEVRVRLPD